MTRINDYLDNPYYKKFLVKKIKLKEKYPQEIFRMQANNKKIAYPEEHQLLFKQYLKELSGLMLEPNGLYQEFMWDIITDSEKQNMEKRTRGNRQGRRKSDFNYY